LLLGFEINLVIICKGTLLQSAMAVVSYSKTKSDNLGKWLLGMIVVSCFSMVYFVAPLYMLSAILVLAFRFPTFYIACLYASPMLLSAVIPSFAAPGLYRYLRPMLDYFEYEEVIESKPTDVAEKILSGTNYLCVCQPHGALSITGIVSAINATRPEFAGKLPTAVADAVLYTPILKHVVGIFGLVSASKESMKKTLKKKGLAGTIILYVGGLAELFLTSDTEEKLYLKKRKGFIKLALTEGVDIVPIYLFGNTSVLSVLKTSFLTSLSRKVRLVQSNRAMHHMAHTICLPADASLRNIHMGQVLLAHSSRLKGKYCFRRVVIVVKK
jgi:Diacylglycerol acyltransferase